MSIKANLILYIVTEDEENNLLRGTDVTPDVSRL